MRALVLSGDAVNTDMLPGTLISRRMTLLEAVRAGNDKQESPLIKHLAAAPVFPSGVL